MADRSHGEGTIRDPLVEAARDELVAGGRHLTIAELAARTGRSLGAAQGWVARNRAAGRLVSVRRGGKLLVPSFQLTEDGDLNPEAALIVAEFLDHEMGAWAIWRWAATPNSWLDGAVPEDVLRLDAARVRRAARSLLG